MAVASAAACEAGFMASVWAGVNVRKALNHNAWAAR